MKTAILKLLDIYFGRTLVATLSKPLESYTKPPRNYLFIRPGGIGDAALLILTIKVLKNVYPACTIDILAERRNADVFSLIPSIRIVYQYDTFAGMLSVLRNSYDVVIDTEQWYRLSAVVARLVRASVKIGFDTNNRRRMFTRCVPYDQHSYEADNFIALLKPLGIDYQRGAEVDTLFVPLHSVHKADQLLQPLASESFIALFPGASISEKRWGTDRFRRMTEVLSSIGAKIVVVGGKEDRLQGEVIAGGGLGLNLTGMTSLSETAAILQKSSLLVSGDSGVLHIAAGLGVPTVSLFGPGRAKKWAPRGDHHIVINKELPCSPCTTFGNTPPCPNNNRCMQDISVDEVVNAVTMLLTSVGAMPSRCCKRDWIETA